MVSFLLALGLLFESNPLNVNPKADYYREFYTGTGTSRYLYGGEKASI